jgi:hypothetical protein
MRWLSEGDHTPDDILEATVIHSTQRYYLPLYGFTGTFHSNWAASSGHNRRETYLDKNLNGKLVERSRTVTDWSPSSGAVESNFAVAVYAGPSSDISRHIRDASEDFFEGSYGISRESASDSCEILKHTREGGAVWNLQGEAKVKDQARSIISKRIPGDTHRGLSFDISMELTETLKTYVPYWIVRYTYKSKNFQVGVHGGNSSKVIGDERPEQDTRKYETKGRYLLGHLGVLGTILWLASGGPEIERMGATVYMSLLWFMLVVTVFLYLRPGIHKRQNIRVSKQLRRMKLEEKLRAVNLKTSGGSSNSVLTHPTKNTLPLSFKRASSSRYFRMAGIALALWGWNFILFGGLIDEKIVKNGGAISILLGLLFFLVLPTTIITLSVKGFNKWKKELDSEQSGSII